VMILPGKWTAHCAGSFGPCRCRVKDGKRFRIGEVARPARGRGDGCGARLSAPHACALVTTEEERAVANDTAAGGRTELVSLEHGLFGTRAIREEVRCVQLVVTDELVSRPMQVIRAGFGLHNHRRAHAEARIPRNYCW
jgi:hypothetical protein